LSDAQIDLRNLRSLVVGGNHAALVFLFQLGDAADMVAVVMGDENIRQRPSLALERPDDGAGFRRVDRGGRLACGVVNEIAEIVVEAGEQANFSSHGISVILVRVPQKGVPVLRLEYAHHYQIGPVGSPL
jgi:hypothetical protein